MAIVTKRRKLFGLTLLKSMACRTSVFCANVCGIPEMGDEGNTGFMVPHDNPKALRDKIAKSSLAIYKELAGRR